MGTYLSTPVTEKGEESGETSELSWGVVDMQGWRKNMEDAHVAQTNVEVPPHLFASDEDSCQDGKVFGVFDGHGGPEVARFCQLYIVSVLIQQPTWRGDVPTSVFENTGEYFKDDPANTPVGHALIQAFHAMDRLINDPLRRYVTPFFFIVVRIKVHSARYDLMLSGMKLFDCGLKNQCQVSTAWQCMSHHRTETILTVRRTEDTIHFIQRKIIMRICC
jgi:hypothetical protein